MYHLLLLPDLGAGGVGGDLEIILNISPVLLDHFEFTGVYRDVIKTSLKLEPGRGLGTYFFIG